MKIKKVAKLVKELLKGESAAMPAMKPFNFLEFLQKNNVKISVAIGNNGCCDGVMLRDNNFSVIKKAEGSIYDLPIPQNEAQANAAAYFFDFQSLISSAEIPNN